MSMIHEFFTTFKTNIKSIVTAVLLSAVAWLVISLQIFPDINQHITDIPVQVNLTPYMIENNLELLYPQELSTSIQINGKRYIVGKYSANDFEAELDLSGITAEGEYVVDIDVTYESTTDFKVTSATNTANIKVAEIVSKTLEVEPQAVNMRLAEGMLIDEPNLSVNPPTVTIKGEKSLIDSITSAEAQAFHEDEIFSTLQLKGELVLFNSDNVRVESPDISLDSDTFMVTVPLHMVKTLPLDFLITGYQNNFDITGLRSKMVLTPHELTLSSPNTSINHLASFEVWEMPISDITLDMLNGVTRETIAPKLPEGYKNISGEAAFSLQFIGVDDYEQFEFAIPRDNITIRNRPSGYNVDILTRELTVSVIGPSSYLRSMSAGDIRVTLNLMGMDITADTVTVSKVVEYRISGIRIPAWVVGYPQVDVSFTRTD